MTGTTTITVPSTHRAPRARAAASGRTAAPFGRLLASEVGLILRRPRTVALVLLLVLTAVALGVGMRFTVYSGGGPLGSITSSTGLVVPIMALTMSLMMLLPLVVSLIAADALAGEESLGTLRGLLLAPVGRVRLVLLKAAGLLVFTVLAVLVVAVAGTVTGVLLLGADGLITTSGSTVAFLPGLGRVALVAGWVALQVYALAMVALAISATTDKPLVVPAVIMAALILLEFVATISALDWLRPALLTEGWGDTVSGVLRDPMMLDDMGVGVLRACCYLLIGLSLTVLRVTSKDQG